MKPEFDSHATIIGHGIFDGSLGLPMSLVSSVLNKAIVQIIPKVFCSFKIIVLF